MCSSESQHSQHSQSRVKGTERVSRPQPNSQPQPLNPNFFPPGPQPFHYYYPTRPKPGACSEFIPSSSCSDVDPGNSKLAECVSQLIFASETASDDAEDPVMVPNECEDQVYDYYIQRSKNINANVPLGEWWFLWRGLGGGLDWRGRGGARKLVGCSLLLTVTPHLLSPLNTAAKACKHDAERLCNGTWMFGPSEGHVTSCLKYVVIPLCFEKRCLLQLRNAARSLASPL